MPRWLKGLNTSHFKQWKQRATNCGADGFLLGEDITGDLRDQVRRRRQQASQQAIS